MRLTPWRSAAVLSLLVLAHPAAAVRRPRYGGTLRVEMRASLANFDPTDNSEASFRLAPLVFDRLVRIDPQGLPRPALAISWTHDPDFRRWQFRLRPGVQFHDASPLTASAAIASALQSALNGRTVSASNGSVIVECPRPSPDLPLELGLRGYIFARTATGAAVGTGPFRLARLDPGRHASFAANDDYWGGRPFLDAIEIEMGRTPRDQWIDLEVGRADLVELGPAEVRRARSADRTVWSSAPLSLLAIVFRDGHPAGPRLREALALSIDRAAIQNVLFQRRADIAGGLLPQWLSGYEFLFSSAPDLAAARRLAGEIPPSARSLSLAHDGDALARSIAERIALNARDAGIAVHVTPPNPNADARLTFFRITSLEPARALAELALALGSREWTPQDAPETLYASERALLDGYRIIPLFHVPEDFGAAPRVKLWTEPAVTRLGGWRLADIWLDGGRP